MLGQVVKKKFKSSYIAIFTIKWRNWKLNNHHNSFLKVIKTESVCNYVI